MYRFALWKLTLVSKYCRGAVRKKLFESIKEECAPIESAFGNRRGRGICQ